MAGEAALIKSGMYFCKKMIREATAVFKRTIDGTLHVDEYVDSEVEDDDDDEATMTSAENEEIVEGDDDEDYINDE
jgi:hypothetical protein